MSQRSTNASGADRTPPPPPPPSPRTDLMDYSPLSELIIVIFFIFVVSISIGCLVFSRANQSGAVVVRDADGTEVKRYEWHRSADLCFYKIDGNILRVSTRDRMYFYELKDGQTVEVIEGLESEK